MLTGGLSSEQWCLGMVPPNKDPRVALCARRGGKWWTQGVWSRAPGKLSGGQPGPGRCVVGLRGPSGFGCQQLCHPAMKAKTPVHGDVPSGRTPSGMSDHNKKAVEVNLTPRQINRN